jgi:hypothetical protein
VFGGAGISWPSASDSLEAVALTANPVEFGGGWRVTNLWQRLFLQVAITHWSDSGERAFVDSEGDIFPLGIPLDVNSTFIDGTVGFQQHAKTKSGRTAFTVYVGGGAGVVRYSESSPFAAADDDLDATKPSYHGLVGVDIPISGRLVFVGEGRYRYVPNLLGAGGTSGALGEDSLGGFQTSIGLRIGFGGRPAVIEGPPAPPRKQPAPIAPTPAPAPQPGAAAPSTPGNADAVIIESASVFLLPDATRTPLRKLAPGTRVRVLEEKGEWLQVEFQDEQYGRRVGYVQRRFVRGPEK